MDHPLRMDVEAMRRAGYATVDALVARLADPGSDAVLRRAGPADMRARLAGPPPEQPGDYGEVLARLLADVLPYASRTDHPGYFAFVPSFTTWPAALAELTAAAANPYCGAWMEAAGPAQVELQVIDWFRGWLGMPGSTSGVLVTGGSAANLTALLVARDAAGGPSDDEIVYVSDQAHSSLARTARAMGLRPHQVRVLPTDDRWRLQPGSVAAAVRADRAAGRVPFALCASGGSTNTGAVDPLADLADVCAAEGLWLHVDAAYGGFAALAPKGRELLAGIERADSVTLDPHKWLFQPMECGSVLVRDGARLERTFADSPRLPRRQRRPQQRRGQLRRPWPAAVPRVPCAQGLGVRADLRPGRVPGCGPAQPRPGRVRRDPGPRPSGSDPHGARGARHRLLPAGVARLRRGRDRAPRAGPGQCPGTQRDGAGLQYPAGRPPRHPALRAQPDELRG